MTTRQEQFATRREAEVRDCRVATYTNLRLGGWSHEDAWERASEITGLRRS